MNKSEFIKELAEKTGYDEGTCIKINNIIEDTFIIGKKNKEKMITDFMQQLGVTEEEANKIYETAMGIVGGGIKDKLKHPFQDQD